ncbi:uncharacterized protein M421DRAFT_422260 [Didymella exigua CBS 183.55]|uniref:Uncharacterized protein n=1 Tax=Didymella exigua CBS 183.55 TaxID=1150837 RepID=A0A6A5RIF8_9PLEO|nr:uncharacterized protein M421DRAFT_422260 [Didymella exigua CBS 183.55]KAF1927020.1 hypothetical protein M421DRAFT_422260 [Didymella exigua CBS 183.55]
MHSKIFAAAVLASAPLALAQSGMTSMPSATSTASGAKVITMMWDNEATAAAAAASGSSMAAGMSGMSMGMSMSMSTGKVKSGMSMATATGTAMAGMNMTGSAGRMEMSSGAMGVGWVVVSIGAGVGFLAGML